MFIECTATDLNKAKIVLDTMVTMFSEYCTVKFQIEAVEVTQVDGSKAVYPTLSERFVSVNPSEVNTKVGIQIDTAKMQALLAKMGLESNLVNEKQLDVKVGPTRSDILHACDVVEDVAISYGFNNIQKTIPKTNCFSNEVISHHTLSLYLISTLSIVNSSKSTNCLTL